MRPKDLPHIDEHVVDIAADSDAVWTALIRTIKTSLSSSRMRLAARLLRCDPGELSDWSQPTAGDSLPGFRIAAVQPPSLIVLAGKHRFSEYAFIFRIDETNGGARCSAESRARFPGWRGRLYRAAIIGSRGHQLVVRRMLREIKRTAEHPL